MRGLLQQVLQQLKQTCALQAASTDTLQHMLRPGQDQAGCPYAGSSKSTFSAALTLCACIACCRERQSANVLASLSLDIAVGTGTQVCG